MPRYAANSFSARQSQFYQPKRSASQRAAILRMTPNYDIGWGSKANAANNEDSPIMDFGQAVFNPDTYFGSEAPLDPGFVENLKGIDQQNLQAGADWRNAMSAAGLLSPEEAIQQGRIVPVSADPDAAPADVPFDYENFPVELDNLALGAPVFPEDVIPDKALSANPRVKASPEFKSGQYYARSGMNVDTNIPALRQAAMRNPLAVEYAGSGNNEQRPSELPDPDFMWRVRQAATNRPSPQEQARIDAQKMAMRQGRGPGLRSWNNNARRAEQLIAAQAEAQAALAREQAAGQVAVVNANRRPLPLQVGNLGGGNFAAGEGTTISRPPLQPIMTENGLILDPKTGRYQNTTGRNDTGFLEVQYKANIDRINKLTEREESLAESVALGIMTPETAQMERDRILAEKAKIEMQNAQLSGAAGRGGGVHGVAGSAQPTGRRARNKAGVVIQEYSDGTWR